MARNLKQVLQQIEQLQREAEALRSKEVAGVIERIRTAIAAYNITPEQLFGPARSTAKAKAASKVKGERPPKYRDASGQTWSGVGKRPRWFVQALESGLSAESLLVPGTEAPRARGSRSTKVAKKSTPTAVSKYQDPSTGKTWTGKGKRPSWFVQAISGGKAAEDLLI